MYVHLFRTPRIFQRHIILHGCCVLLCQFTIEFQQNSHAIFRLLNDNNNAELRAQPVAAEVVARLIARRESIRWVNNKVTTTNTAF